MVVVSLNERCMNCPVLRCEDERKYCETCSMKNTKPLDDDERKDFEEWNSWINNMLNG